MSKMVGFQYGCLADPLEKQANAQGYTLKDEAERLQKILWGLQYCYVHSVITGSEYDRILQRFQKKLIVPALIEKGDKV